MQELEHRKRVVHATTGHTAFDTRVFEKECKSLAQAGYNVALVVPHDCDQVVNDVRIKATPTPRNRFDRFTAIARCVYKEALRQKGSVYHFHDPEMIPFGLMLRLRKKRVIYDVHDDTPATFAEKYYIPRLLRGPLMWLFRILENAAARQFTAIIAATPAIAERFSALNERTVVIQNFALLDDIWSDREVSWHDRPLSVAFIGAVGRERGIAEMLQAMSMLPKSLPARLAIAGWFHPESLRDESAACPGWQRVDELGMLDRRGVAAMLKRVRAGLLTYHPFPNHLRAGPNKLFEYMSAGIPVIASDFPVWRSIVEDADCGFLVDPLNPKEIAGAIEYVMTHPCEAEQMGRRGRAKVEQLYNWKFEQLKLLDLYASLLREQPKLRDACATDGMAGIAS